MKELRVVIFREEENWIAQGVDLDICAFAPSLRDLFQAFALAVFANVAVARERGDNPLKSVPPAPARFFDMFEAAAISVTPRGETAARFEAGLPRGQDAPPPPVFVLIENFPDEGAIVSH